MMTSSATTKPEPSPIAACTISRDVQNFDLLIEDMETALGENWGDLGFSEALAFFGQPEAEHLEFVAFAMDESDEDDLVMMGEIITQAKARDIKVILIAEDVTPAALHQLLRQGADEFVPYPLPEGELEAAIERLRNKPQPAAAASRCAIRPARTGVIAGRARAGRGHRSDHACGEPCLGTGDRGQEEPAPRLPAGPGSAIRLRRDLSRPAPPRGGLRDVSDTESMDEDVSIRRC